MCATRGAATFGQLVDFATVDAPLICKEEDMVQRARKEEVNDLVFLPRTHAFDTATAAALFAEGLSRHALDVGAGAIRDEHILLRNQVFFIEVAIRARQNLRAPLIAKFFFQAKNVFTDDVTYLLWLCQ